MNIFALFSSQPNQIVSLNMMQKCCAKIQPSEQGAPTLQYRRQTEWRTLPIDKRNVVTFG